MDDSLTYAILCSNDQILREKGSPRPRNQMEASAQAQHQVKGGFLLNVVVRERAAVLKLLAGKDQPLLVRGDALLVLFGDRGWS